MSNPNKRKKIIKTTAIVVVICAIGGVAYSSYSKSVTKKAEAAMSQANSAAIAVEAISKKDVRSVISATGKVEAEKIYSISLSTIQEISKVLVAVGDEVKQDQALIEYDYISSKEKLDKKLKDANISLKTSQLNLKTYNIPSTPDEIAAFKNAVVAAEKALYQSQLDLKENTNQIEDAKKAIEDAQKAIEDNKRDIIDEKTDVDNAQTDIDNAQRDIDNAQKDLDSSKQLFDIGAISQQEHDKAQTAYDDKVKAHNTTVKSYNTTVKSYDDKVKAQSDKETAYDNAIRALSDLEAKTKTYEYNITTAKYNLEKSQKDLKDGQNPTMTAEEKIKYEQQQLSIQSNQINIEDIQSQINDLVDISTSPIDGVIIEKNVEDGDVAKESTALLKVADTSKLKVRATVSEYDASNISLNQTVTMTSDGIRDKVYTGKVIFIDPQAKSSNEESVVTIDVSIENSDMNLKPGFTIDLEILTGDSKDVLSVPIASILTDEQKQKYVYTVTPENTLKKTIITTGVYGDMYVETKSGITEGENVVTSPNTSMKEGDPITVAPSQPTEGGNKDDKAKGGNSSVSVQIR